jgi:lipopolysaccharide exporter
MRDLARRTAIGVAQLGMASVWSAVIQVVGLGVLARELSAAEFGVATLAIVIVRFGQENAALGLETTVVQRKALTDEDATGCFWVATGSSVIVWLSYVLAAPYVSNAMGLSSLGTAIRGVSGVIVVTSLGVVPRALLERRLAYDRVALLESLGQACSYIIAIGLALRGAGVWSPLSGFLIGEGVKTVSFWAVARWHPHGSIRSSRPVGVLRFGGFVTADRVLTYLTLSIDRVIIARVLGAAAAGHYAMAFEAAAFPSKRIGMLVGRVLLPALSRLESKAEVGRFFISTVRYLTLFTVPALVGLAIVSPEISGVLYGSKAGSVALILTILCVPGIVFAILSPSGSLLYGAGRPDVSAAWSALTLGVVATAVFVGTRWGLVGAAIGVAVAWVVLLPVMEYVVARLGHLPLAAPYRALDGAFGAAVWVCGCAGAFRMLSRTLIASTSAWLLVGTVLAGVAAFVTFLFVNEKPLAARLIVWLRPGGSPC